MFGCKRVFQFVTLRFRKMDDLPRPLDATTARTHAHTSPLFLARTTTFTTDYAASLTPFQFSTTKTFRRLDVQGCGEYERENREMAATENHFMTHDLTLTSRRTRRRRFVEVVNASARGSRPGRFDEWHDPHPQRAEAPHARSAHLCTGRRNDILQAVYHRSTQPPGWPFSPKLSIAKVIDQAAGKTPIANKQRRLGQTTYACLSTICCSCPTVGVGCDTAEPVQTTFAVRSSRKRRVTADTRRPILQYSTTGSEISTIF